MKKIILLYWPKGGNVEKSARLIHEQFDESQIHLADIMSIVGDELDRYEYVIAGGSTVGAEIWEEADDSFKWESFFKELDKANLKGKKVALFGLGDQVLYPNHFVDGMGIMKKEFEKRGARIIGHWPTDTYEFTDSDAIENGKFVGLAIDEDQQSDLTESRVKEWTKLLKKEFGL